MSNEDHSRRGFLKGAGLIAGGFLGESVLPDAAAAQSGARTTAAAMSKGARFRAALSTGQPLLLPVVESIILTRLCEIEGFQGGFMGGSGMAARNALPNTSIQTIQEVIDYERHVMSNTDLPIVADGENGGGSPVTTYRTVQQLERAGAAVIMLEDSTGPESEYGGKGVAMATKAMMVGRIKAAVDAGTLAVALLWEALRVIAIVEVLPALWASGRRIGQAMPAEVTPLARPERHPADQVPRVVVETSARTGCVAL